MLKEPENWCLQGMPQADHHQNIIYTCKSVSQSQESIMCFQGSFKKNQNKATCTEATSNRQNLSDFRPQSFPPGPRSVSIAGQQGPLLLTASQGSKPSHWLLHLSPCLKITKGGSKSLINQAFSTKDIS